jgi:hypothetical protein
VTLQCIDFYFLHCCINTIQKISNSIRSIKYEADDKRRKTGKSKLKNKGIVMEICYSAVIRMLVNKLLLYTLISIFNATLFTVTP